MLDNKAIKYAGNDDSKPENKILDYQSQEIENKLRIERTLRTGSFKLTYGGGYEFVKYNNNTYNRIFTASGAQTINYSSAFNMGKYSMFSQASQSFNKEKLVLSAGLRVDGNTYSKDMSNP